MTWLDPLRDYELFLLAFALVDNNKKKNQMGELDVQ